MEDISKEKLTIKRYIYPNIQSNMYVILENTRALIVDPHCSQEAEEYLTRNHVDEVLILLTHEHFDHTNGINRIMKTFHAKLICQENALDAKMQKFCNRPTVISLKLLDEGKAEEAEAINRNNPPYTYTADTSFKDCFDTEWNGHRIHMESAPGHSPASCLIYVDDDIVFTGDSLIPNIPTIVRWPWSDSKAFEEVTMDKLLHIPHTCIVYPGHESPVRMGSLLYNGSCFALKK